MLIACGLGVLLEEPLIEDRIATLLDLPACQRYGPSGVPSYPRPLASQLSQMPGVYVVQAAAPRPLHNHESVTYAKRVAGSLASIELRTAVELRVIAGRTGVAKSASW